MSSEVGDIISFGTYSWRVLSLEAEKMLVITEDIITQQPYHDKKGPVTWSDCALRKYLNCDFYQSFLGHEKEKIVPVINVNANNQWYDAEGGVNTKDYVFLLSIDEVVCKYFGDSQGLLLNPSPKQRYWFQRKDENNVKRRAAMNNCSWWWWLRSPGRDGKRAVYVHGDGNIGIQGNGTFNYCSKTLHPLTRDNSGGVRPALWLKRE